MLINITGLWKSQSGQSLTGRIGFSRVIVYKNKNKKGEKSPDYMLAFAEVEDDGGRKPSGGGGGYKERRPSPPPGDDVAF